MNRHFAKQKPDFLTFRNGEFKIKETGNVVGYAYCLSGTEHVSGEQLPVAVKTIFFDECFTRFPELPREFETWQILLSTIIRERDDVNIYMVGNTVCNLEVLQDIGEIYLSHLSYSAPDALCSHAKSGECILLLFGSSEKFHIALE